MRAPVLAAALALASLAHASLALAAEPAPEETQARESLSALHRLGSDARQLRFDGENMTRVWPIYATVGQTTGRARLHIAYTNAISVMPEASSIAVSVNDVPVAQSPVNAGGDQATLDVELPKGLLKPGYNALRIAVAQRHRVDCSLEATYELWTQLDLAGSGLSFPAQSEPSIAAIDDIPAVSPGASGAVQIHAVSGRDAKPAELDRLLGAAQMIAIRGGFARPEVDVVEAVADKPGLYVAVGDSAWFTRNGLKGFAASGPGVAFGGADVPGRTVIAISGEGPKEIAGALASLLPAGWDQARHATPAAERALANAGGFRAAGDSRIILRDLGVDSEDFTGRMFRAGFDLVLPPDFYPADYDKMTLLIDASYGAGLTQASQILVRVNDKEAGSLPLRNPRGDTLRARPIGVSLSALRPGFNRVVIEAQTPNDGDKGCAVDKILAGGKRFSLSDHTEIVIPRIARIARLPDLAVTMASGFPYERSEAAHLFLASHSPQALGSAATLLARAAVASRRPMHTRLTYEAADLAEGSALLLGTPSPAFGRLAERFGLDLPGMKQAWAHPVDGQDETEDGARAGAKAAGTGEENFDQWADASRSLHPKLDFTAQLRALYDRYFNVHASDFTTLRPRDAMFSPPADTALVLAQAKAPSAGDTWTIVMGADDEALARGVRALVAPTSWNRLEGRAAALNIKTGAVVTAASNSPYFIVTAALTPANFRLVAAGWLSSNADVYSAIAALAALCLGMATYATVRRHGVRQ